MVGLVMLGVLSVLAPACSGDVSIAPPTPSDTSDSAGAAAQLLLERLGPALSSGTTRELDAIASGDPEGRRLLTSVAANVRDLALSGVDFRYVESAPDLVAAATDYPVGATLVHADLTYRLRPWDARATTLETSVVLVPDGNTLRVAGFGPQADRTPLWLMGRVAVARAARALVIADGTARADRLLPLARKAVADVDAVLPDWRGRLVVEAPGSQDALDAELSADPGQYSAIAAVTTTVDGSLETGDPVHVFVNPAVFDKLGPRGSQVVMSHETTHVATNASFSSMPKWLSEGFADYVALDHADIPVSTAAGQILARVRRSGPPRHLPTTQDLDPSATGLGATYEEAWLACRFLGRTYGEHRLVTFYRRVDGGLPLAAAFRQVLGTTQTAFVRAWSRDVADLARLAG